MKISTVRAIFFFLLVMTTCAILCAQDTDATKATNAKKQIDFLMNEEYKLGTFNGNVLVMKDGALIYQSEFGYSAADKKTKLTSAYRFNIGSIGKEFNA